MTACLSFSAAPPPSPHPSVVDAIKIHRLNVVNPNPNPDSSFQQSSSFFNTIPIQLRCHHAARSHRHLPLPWAHHHHAAALVLHAAPARTSTRPSLPLALPREERLTMMELPLARARGLVSRRQRKLVRCLVDVAQYAATELTRNRTHTRCRG